MILLYYHFGIIHDSLYSSQMIENIFIEDNIINSIPILYFSQPALGKITYLGQLYLQMIIFITQLGPHITHMLELLTFLIDQQLMQSHIEIMYLLHE